MKTIDFKIYCHTLKGIVLNDSHVLNTTFDPLWNISKINLDQKCAFEQTEFGSKVQEFHIIYNSKWKSNALIVVYAISSIFVE